MEYLKIKDEVALKELEKFGFVNDNNNYVYESEEWAEDYPDDEKHKPLFTIAKRYDSRYLEVEFTPSWRYETTEELPNLLFDLIQAGLVEKAVDV